MNAVKVTKDARWAERYLALVQHALEAAPDYSANTWLLNADGSFTVVHESRRTVQRIEACVKVLGGTVIRRATYCIAQAYEVEEDSYDVCYRSRLEDVDCGDTDNNLAWSVRCWQTIFRLNACNLKRVAV